MAAAPMNGYIMRRPTLHDYAAWSGAGLTVETYRSDAGEMLARSPRHRITLNRTAHRRYAHRLGDAGAAVRLARPQATLGFEPAGMALWVDGDAADYVSIFQEPALYRSLQEEAGLGSSLAEQPFLAQPDGTCRHLVEALASLAGAGQPAEPMLAEHLGLALAMCVLRQAGRAAPPAMAGSLSEAQRRRVLAVIEARLDQRGLTLRELADAAGLSPFHFARAFKASFGTPPHRFLVEQRIARARALIREGRLGLAEIALATGFADQAHFCAVFRRETGLTPGRFRQQV